MITGPKYVGGFSADDVVRRTEDFIASFLDEVEALDPDEREEFEQFIEADNERMFDAARKKGG